MDTSAQNSRLEAQQVISSDPATNSASTGNDQNMQTTLIEDSMLLATY